MAFTETVTASGDRRGAILRGALEAFTEKGYAGTTIEDVRARSGASTGSIYHHFGSKEGIAAALYVEGLADYQRGFLAELRRRRSPAAAIRAVVRHHIRWVVDNPELASHLLGRREAEVVLAGEAPLRALNRAFMDDVRAWLEPHVQAGRIRRLPFDLFASILIGPSQEWARHWLAGRARSSPEAAQRALAEAAWQALEAR
jgi:AcrR family transcriptional regulator